MVERDIPVNSEGPDLKTIMVSTPILVIDTRDPSWYHTEAEEQWAKDQGVDPNDVFRCEVYSLDTLCALWFLYVRGNAGLLVRDGDRYQYSTRITPINSMPPKRDGVDHG